MPTNIVKRYPQNPILTKDDVPYPVATVHNAGVVKHNDRYIMLFRSHLKNGRSIIGRADSNIETVAQPEANPEQATLLFTISVKDRDHMARVLRRLKRNSYVIRVNRVG
jgi:predicted GH43/DUF377 family glycosyl hydrolase